MRPHRLGAFICLLISIFGAHVLVFASQAASLTGRVTDPSGSVIVSATVEATNIDTNVTSLSETNSEGLFVIPNLSPGRYRVTVRKQGFQAIVKPDVGLHVQDVVALNFSMIVGSVSQS